jgi:SSS family solute:Na+ symporter
VTPELRGQAVAVLRSVLGRESGWVKVHAAEFLLALDYPQGVRDMFLQEWEVHGHEPQYRHGIWRVLAESTGDDAEATRWKSKIRDVAADPAAADRLHAMESLAKVGYKLSVAEAGRFEDAARSPSGALAVYAAWVLVNSGRPGAEARLAELLESSDAATRGAAAYALGHLGDVPAAVQQKVVELAKQELSQGGPAASAARIHLVCAAALYASPGRPNEFQARLLECAADGPEADRFQACLTLGRLATDVDLPMLSGLLTDPAADVRCGAAAAVLHVGRRVPRHLGAVDWGVIGLYAAGMLAVGWYYSRRVRSREEYLLGGRRMNSLTVGVSLFASLISTISYLAYPGEVIKNGPMILCMVAAYPLVILVVGGLIIPFIMKLRVTSAYEILEYRLGLGVRLLGSLLFLTLRLLWMGVIIYAATTKVVVPLFGLPAYATPVVCAALGLVTVMYTSMGGIRAVVLTDVIQSIILFGSAILIVVFVTYSLGGVSGWWPARWPEQWPAPKLYDPGVRVSFLSALIASFAWHVCTSGSDQIAIQRYLSTKDVRGARTVLVTTLAADTIIGTILVAAGLGLWGYFRANPHLLPDGGTIVAQADRLLPQFIVVGFPVGLSGLVVAGLLASAMSCLAAGVNSSCSVITVDFIDRLRPNRSPEPAGRVRLAKYVSVLIGVAVVLLSFLIQIIPGNLLELAYKVVNLLTAPIFGLFFMALFVRWATGFGTIVGALFGIAAALTINFWEPITGTRPIVSFLWAMPVSFVVEVGLASLLSLLPLGRSVPLEHLVRPAPAEESIAGRRE